MRALVVGIVSGLVVAGLPVLPGLPSAVSAPPAAAVTGLAEPRLGRAEALAGWGNPFGGAPAEASCGDYAVTSITGYQNDEPDQGRDWLNGITFRCAPAVLDGGAAAVGTAFDGPGYGPTTDRVSTATCPAGSLAVGATGTAGALVDAITLLCAPLDPATGTLGAAEATSRVGGAGGGGRPAQLCPAGSVMTGATGRSGDGLDFFSVVCRSLTFAPDLALRFAGGTTAARVVATVPGTATLTRDLTLAADVRWDGGTGVRGVVSRPASDGPGAAPREGWSLLVDDGRPCLSVLAVVLADSEEEAEPTTELRRVCAPAALPAGAWAHLEGVYTGTSASVTVDGVTTTRTWGMPADALQPDEGAALVVGRLFADDGVSGFGGDIDAVEVLAGRGTTATNVVTFAFDEGTGGTTAGRLPGTDEGGAPLTVTADLLPADSADTPAWVGRAAGDGQPDNTTWPTALTLTSGTEVTGALRAPGEARWYRIPVQPDARVRVDVTDLPADYDVTLYKDIGQAFTKLLVPSDLDTLSAEFAGDAFAPSVFSPSVFSPSVFSPSVFSPSVFSPSVFSPSVFSPSVFSPSVFSPSVFSDAWSSAQTRSLVAVSARDGLADESVASATWDNTGYFYVRVIGRSGASSPAPFRLVGTTTGGACSTTLSGFAADALGSYPAGPAQTVVLTDSARVPGTAQQVADLMADLGRLATATDGVVVDLALSPRVVALNAQADGVKDCPYAKNLVAAAAREIVNGYRAADGSPGSLKYVVLAGGDGVVPFVRYPDAAGLGPESGYVPPVADDTASQASLRRNTFLSQDAYGARVDVSVKGAELPVPDVAVGRLVETAPEISATVRGYVGADPASTTSGTRVITPASSLVTGYDFLTDAADAVSTTLRAGIGGTGNEALVTDSGVPPSTTTVGGVPSRTTSWTADDLRATLFTRKHDITYLAGHFSANSALAADYSTSVVTTEVATAATARPDLFRNTLVVSAGCHSGYNLLDADGVPGLTLGLDWAQAFAQQGATLVAGTGYQYGDTDFLEYSERLYAGFMQQLHYGTGADPAAVPVGAALLAAKQQYLADTPSLRGIHTKALLESTLFGLPMLGVDLPNRVPAPATASTVAVTDVPAGTPGATLGLRSGALALDPVALTPTSRTLTSTDGGSVTATYLSGPDGVVTNPAEPALPLVRADVTVPGTTLRGIGWRGGTYADTDGVLPLTGAATTETNAVHAPFTSSAFYPSRLATGNWFGAVADPQDGRTRLAVTPAQYRSDAPGSSTTTQRRYSALDFELFYSNNIATYGGNTPALAAPPTMSGVDAPATAGATSVPVAVHVVGDPSAGVQKVWVTYTGVPGSPFHGTWASVDLTQDTVDTTLWRGVVDLPTGQSAGDVRFLVQAVNGVGLVSADDNGGRFWTPGATDPVTAATAAQTPTTLTLGATPSGVRYGTTADVSATLADASGPLADRTVRFTLGTASATARTGADGVATATLPVVDAPGPVDVQAAFDGDPGGTGAAASTSAVRGVTVTKVPTTLTLSGGPVVVPAGVASPSGVTATLTAGGLPVRAHTVYLAVTGSGGSVVAAASRITDVDGKVALGDVTLPAGTYTVAAAFGGPVTLPDGSTTSLADPVYAGSSATAPGVLTAVSGPRSATVVSGDGQVGTAGQPFDKPLVAKVLDAAGAPLAGTPVTFAVTSGGAAFATSGTGTTRSVTVTTGPGGLATSPALVAGTTAGPVVVTATADAAAPPVQVTFRASVVSLANARADLAARVTAPASAARGSTFTTTVTVTNAGPNTAAKVVTGLTVGAPLTVVSAPGGTLVKGVWTWTAAGLPVGGSVTYTVTLKASTTRAATGGVAVATASAVPDPRLTNNVAATTVRIP
ncbi:LamG-like jellyroll fold domain-containing protein [Kineosporia sp. R_H_3]|uniref:LamG-like jellyroll fold domain-containing protein n=1 Tax=Kineosporia sp. R_H_3 TaxID=1961848 RepID=UPI000B4AD6E1|nr:LamG-like jellyroll fold domain-containing protein [Kineosporia sp. R_H_3]